MVSNALDRSRNTPSTCSLFSKASALFSINNKDNILTHRKAMEALIHGQKITPTYFQRCQDIVVQLKCNRDMIEI